MRDSKKWCIILACLITVIILAFSCKSQAITLQDYCDAVRWEVLGDTGLANDPLTTAMITEWVNGGRDLVAAISGGLQKDTIIVTVAGQVSYLLPSDFLKLKGVITPPKQVASDLSVVIKSSRSKGPEDLGIDPNGVGNQEEWIQWGTDTAKLYLNPVPYAEYDVHLLYVAKPLDFDSVVDVCDLPRAYQEVVTEYAIAKAYGSQGMSTKASEAWALFNSWLQALISTLSDRRTEVPSEK
jgi:hypothetical protein